MELCLVTWLLDIYNSLPYFLLTHVLREICIIIDPVSGGTINLCAER
jgi:hypothetical protein